MSNGDMKMSSYTHYTKLLDTLDLFQVCHGFQEFLSFKKFKKLYAFIFWVYSGRRRLLLRKSRYDQSPELQMFTAISWTFLVLLMTNLATLLSQLSRLGMIRSEDYVKYIYSSQILFNHTNIYIYVIYRCNIHQLFYKMSRKLKNTIYSWGWQSARDKNSLEPDLRLSHCENTAPFYLHLIIFITNLVWPSPSYH